jgi:hypothetical protein
LGEYVLRGGGEEKMPMLRSLYDAAEDAVCRWRRKRWEQAGDVEDTLSTDRLEESTFVE